MITVGLLFHQLLLSAICVVGVCSLHHMSAAYVSSLPAYHAMIGNMLRKGATAHQARVREAEEQQQRC